MLKLPINYGLNRLPNNMTRVILSLFDTMHVKSVACTRYFVICAFHICGLYSDELVTYQLCYIYGRSTLGQYYHDLLALRDADISRPTDNVASGFRSSCHRAGVMTYILELLEYPALRYRSVLYIYNSQLQLDMFQKWG